MAHEWVKEFPGRVEVCNRDGILVEINDRGIAFEGGKIHVGDSVLACHPEPARSKLAHLLATGERNVYTIEKNGARRLIYQAPWFVDGQMAGVVELALDIPEVIPHFVRK